MDTMRAVIEAERAKSAGARHRVFDWDEAARRIVASGAKCAGAGLQADWGWTGGDILRDGKPVPKDETYTYLASSWAAPELTLDDGTEAECWKFSDDAPGWDSGTYWPESALAILNAATNA